MVAKRLIPLFGVIALVVVAGTSFAVLQNNKRPVIVEPTPTSQDVKGVTAETNYPDPLEFSSQALGITFKYLPAVNGSQFKTQESGRKVFVYDTKMKPEDGQFAEVFEKPANMTLAEAIKTKFLAGKSESDCWVLDVTDNFTSQPETYQFAEITYPKQNSSDAAFWENGKKCSAEYAQSNGIRYFVMDTNHPDKFVFFSIGQYGILAGPGTTWQDTFRFLEK